MGIFPLQETCQDTDFVYAVQNFHSLPSNYELVLFLSTKILRDFFFKYMCLYASCFYLYASHTDKIYLICIKYVCLYIRVFLFGNHVSASTNLESTNKWILDFFLKYSLGRGKQNYRHTSLISNFSWRFISSSWADSSFLISSPLITELSVGSEVSSKSKYSSSSESTEIKLLPQ